MYRPNRIGSYPLGDIDQALVIRADATMDALTETGILYGAMHLNATLHPEVHAQSFQWTSAPTQNTAESLGIGVAVAPDEISNQDAIYGVHGFLSFALTIPAAILYKVDLIIGRLTGAPSTSASTEVKTPVFLPFRQTIINDVVYCSANVQYVNFLGINGGTLSSPNLGVSAFWRIVNGSGSDITYNLLTGRIGIHAYRSDLDTVDPSR